MNATTRGNQGRSEWLRRIGSGADYNDTGQQTTLASGLVTAAAISCGGRIAATRPTRKSIVIANSHASNAVWISMSTTLTGVGGASGTGFRVGPGQAYTGTYKGTYYVADDGASAATIYVSDEYY